MPLTEKEKNLITTTGWYESPEAMFKDIEKAVARCEQDAVKEFENKVLDRVNKRLRVDVICGKCIKKAEESAKAEERKRILVKLEGCIRQYEALKEVGSFEKEEYREGKLSAYKWVKAELEKGGGIL